MASGLLPSVAGGVFAPPAWEWTLIEAKLNLVLDIGREPFTCAVETPRLAEQKLLLLSSDPRWVSQRRENGPQARRRPRPRRFRLETLIWNQAAAADVPDGPPLFTERDNATRRMLRRSNRANRSLLGGASVPGNKRVISLLPVPPRFHHRVPPPESAARLIPSFPPMNAAV